MRTEHLVYFIHVVQCGSIRLASTELFISPQGISQAIQHLEKELNTILFHRNNNKLTLTASGKLLYNAAVDMIQLMDDLKVELQDIDSQSNHKENRLLTIYSCAYIGAVFLPQIANDFMSKNPHTRVRILESSPQDLEALLHANLD